LYELWRRLPDTTVLTTPYEGAAAFDAAQSFRVERVKQPVLLPRPGLPARIDALAREVGAATIFVDPMLPVGLVGRSLHAAPHVVVAHGAEITLPGRLPGLNLAARSVLHAADGVVAAGEYPAREVVHAARGPVRGVVIPPGVDVDRFQPLDAEGRAVARRRFGLDPNRPLILGASRLVPRKGFDVVIDAVAGLDVSVQLAIAGAGRDRSRLEAWVGASGSSVAFAMPTSRRCTRAPTCSRWRVATVGSAWRPRGSGSCSSRPRQRASPQSRAAAADHTKRSSTARPGSSSIRGPLPMSAGHCCVSSATSRPGGASVPRPEPGPSRSSPTTRSRRVWLPLPAVPSMHCRFSRPERYGWGMWSERAAAKLRLAAPE
jgi:hypothetical protein